MRDGRREREREERETLKIKIKLTPKQVDIMTSKLDNNKAC